MALITGSISTDLWGIAVALIIILVAYVKWSLTYWERQGAPYYPPTFLFGNVKDLIFRATSFGDLMIRIYDKFKDNDHKYIGGYFFTTPFLMPMDPELVKNILVRDFDHFMDRGVYVNEKGDPLGAHLFSLAGTRWRNLRMKLTPTFTSGKMKMMFQTLVNCSDGLAQIVEDSGENPVDIKDVVGRFTTDVIGTCAFGLDCNSLKDPDTKFRVLGKKVFNPSFIDGLKTFLTPMIPNLMKFFNVSTTNKEVSKFYLNVVRETIDYREKNNVKRNDFMNLLLQLKNTGKLEDEDQQIPSNENASEAPMRLTFEQIAAQSFLFFAAGFETSSTTLTFCLYELVKNIQLQEKLRREINEVLAQHNGKITYEGLIVDMKYMDNVINETLRKYPPLSILTRLCVKEYNSPELDVHIPKGRSIFVPVLGLHRDPKHYPNPDKFDPDRFTEEGKKTRHPYTFIPFGEGPRNCIGLRFGIMQTKVALTVLLKNFRFTLNDKTQEPIVMDPGSFILSVEGGVWLNASKI